MKCSYSYICKASAQVLDYNWGLSKRHLNLLVTHCFKATSQNYCTGWYNLNLEEKPGKVKWQKNRLKRGDKWNTYLTHDCRQPWIFWTNNLFCCYLNHCSKMYFFKLQKDNFVLCWEYRLISYLLMWMGWDSKWMERK